MTTLLQNTLSLQAAKAVKATWCVLGSKRGYTMHVEAVSPLSSIRFANQPEDTAAA